MTWKPTPHVGSLLEHQEALVAYLSDPSAFLRYGDEKQWITDLGLDPQRLKFVGELVFRKRVRKIRSVLPRTLDALGERSRDLLIDFARENPAPSLLSFESALQFVRYLQCISLGHIAYIPDVAAVELALYRTNNPHNVRDVTISSLYGLSKTEPDLRISPSAELVFCEHDIRCIFDGSKSVPIQRRVILIVYRDQRAATPRVLEVSQHIADVLISNKQVLEQNLGSATAYVLDEETASLLIELQIIEGYA